MKSLDELNLQLMAEGGDGAAGGDGASGEGAAAQADAAEVPAAKTPEEEWRELTGKGGKFHDLKARDVSTALQQRTKGVRSKAESWDKVAAKLGGRYGLRGDDPGLIDKILGDMELLEPEALRTGTSNEAVDQLVKERQRADQAEGIIRSILRENDERVQEEQKKKLAEEYPDIDMDEVLNNSDVRNLLDNFNGAFTLEQAMRVVYGDRMISSAVDKAKRATAAAAAAGQNRPRENGAGAAQAGAPVKTSAWDMSPKEFKEMKRRAERGERVSLG